MYILWGNIFDSLLILYVCPLKKKDQSIILMVGLFEQWERIASKKKWKMHFNKVIHLFEF